MDRHDSGFYLAVVPDSIDCDFAELLISRRLDGELASDDVPLLESHLKTCAACRKVQSEWIGHSAQLKENLATLLPHPEKSVRKRRSPLWVPAGMVASQAAALLALAFYLNFFASPAQAPKLSHIPAAPKAQPRTQQAAQTSDDDSQPEAQLPGGEGEPLSVALADAGAAMPLPEEEEQRADFANETAATEVALEPAPEKEPAPLAAMREVIIPRLIPNVSIEYTLRDPDGGSDIAGRMDVLGDILNDRAVIRIRDSRSGLKEVAQADINTLLPEPERRVARRLVAACKLPELRSRFEELIRKNQP